MSGSNDQSFEGAMEAYGALKRIMAAKGAPEDEIASVDSMIDSVAIARREDDAIKRLAAERGEPESSWLMELRERRVSEHRMMAARLLSAMSGEGGCPGSCSGCGGV